MNEANLTPVPGAASPWAAPTRGSTMAFPDKEDLKSPKYEVVENLTVAGLPQVAMNLKEATSFYAMYLSFAQRDRLFSELDFLLDEESWCDADEIPQRKSYLNFLKWAVETKENGWSSLSLDRKGHLIAAYVGNRGLLTAAFLPNDLVQWTSKVETQDGTDFSAGQSPLRVFAETSKAMISRL